MAGHALAIADGSPETTIVGVEPAGADDFRQSMAAQKRVRISKPTSICDGLLSYDVGENNWPILRHLVRETVVATDEETCQAMGWLNQHHGLRTEPSGAITTAAALSGQFDLSGDGDVVLVVSGRNVDLEKFQQLTG
jgi:threonine dehydratase